MEPHIHALRDSTYRPVWFDYGDWGEPLAPLLKNETCQLLIVGGGFTGLWAALQAREQNPDLDIVLVEKTFIGDGASGRNGGFLSSSLTHGETNGYCHFPGETARLHELGRQNLREYVNSLERYEIDADYVGLGAMSVATNEAMVASLRARYEEAREEGEDVAFFDQDAVREKVNSPTYLAGVWWREGLGGTLNPGKLCIGLKKTLLTLGVRIYEGTPIKDTRIEGNGMRTQCPGGSVYSDRVLMATNAYPNPVSRINKSVIPVWDYQIATEPLNQEQLEAIRWGNNRFGLSNEANMFHYYRMTSDNRITWGGGGAVCYYYGGRTDFGVADDQTRFERLSREFLHTFPQLEGVRFTHRWSGIIASSTRFCMVPGVAFGGRVAWAVGYTGLGVGATRFGARIGLELLGYQPSDVLDMLFVRKRAMNWAPEPLRWIGVTLTRHALSKADANGGRRGLWLKLLDSLNMGFAC